MFCTLYYWLWGLGCFLIGVLGSNWFLRKRVQYTEDQVERGKVNLQKLESEYADLRTSTHSKANALKRERDDLHFKLNHDSPPLFLEANQKALKHNTNDPDSGQATQKLHNKIKSLQIKNSKKSKSIKKHQKASKSIKKHQKASHGN